MPIRAEFGHALCLRSDAAVLALRAIPARKCSSGESLLIAQLPYTPDYAVVDGLVQ